MSLPLCFTHPSNIIVAGPTGCGKTFFVNNVLKYRLFAPMPRRIVVVYAEWQRYYDDWKDWYPNAEFVHGFTPTIYERFDARQTNLLVIDDQMGEAGKSSTLLNLFTRGSHHRNLSVLYLVQNIFDKGSAMRGVNLNAQYIVTFKNARDRMQLVTLGKQMFPDKAQVLTKLIDQETKERPRAYLIVCTRPDVQDRLRVYNGIFPGETFHCFPLEELDNQSEPVYLVEVVDE